MRIILSLCLLMALTCSAFDPRGFCEWRLGMDESKIMEIIKKRDLSYSITKDSWYRISITPKEGDSDSVLARGSEYKVSEIRFAFLSNTLFEISIVSPKIKIYRDTSKGTIPQIDYYKTDMLSLFPQQIRWLESANFYLSLRHGPRMVKRLITSEEMTQHAAMLNVEFGSWYIEKHKVFVSLEFRNSDENENKAGFIIIKDISQLITNMLDGSNL